MRHICLYIGVQIFIAYGCAGGSTRGSTRGPRGPKKKARNSLLYSNSVLRRSLWSFKSVFFSEIYCPGQTVDFPYSIQQVIQIRNAMHVTNNFDFFGKQSVPPLMRQIFSNALRLSFNLVLLYSRNILKLFRPYGYFLIERRVNNKSLSFGLKEPNLWCRC